jgi:hypothetical protein
LLAAYAAVAIVTFGHAADRRAKINNDDYSRCLSSDRKTADICDARRAFDPPPVLAGLAAAPLWPLYWSWEAWADA